MSVAMAFRDPELLELESVAFWQATNAKRPAAIMARERKMGRMNFMRRLRAWAADGKGSRVNETQTRFG